MTAIAAEDVAKAVDVLVAESPLKVYPSTFRGAENLIDPEVRKLLLWKNHRRELWVWSEFVRGLPEEFYLKGLINA